MTRLARSSENASSRVWAPALALIALIVGCARNEAPPNVVLIVLDTLRADHLSTYGYARPTSPNIDRLANESLVYEDASTVTNHTLPAHVSLMTGVHPATHKVENNRHQFRGAQPLLAELLRDQGYATAGFVGGFPLSARSGLGRGFAHYEDTRVDGTKYRLRVPALEITPKAIAWLEEQQGAPFFLFVHFFDTHIPYDEPAGEELAFEVDERLTGWMSDRGLADVAMREIAPPPVPDFELATVINGYDNQIHRVDAQVGALLDALERMQVAENTLVILTSDHGEGLGQHGYYSHALHLYEEQMRIALIVRPPSTYGRAPRRVDTAVSLIDIAPTVLGYAGLEVPPGYQGVALPELSEANAPAEPRPAVLAERYHPLPGAVEEGDRFTPKTTLRALRAPGSLKYLVSGDGDEQLYDLIADPYEVRNLAPERPEQVARLRESLRLLVAEHEGTAPAVEQLLDEQDEAALRALGYAD